MVQSVDVQDDESKYAGQSDFEVTAGGHLLPKDWLMRVALIWSGYAASAVAGNAVSYSGVWFITETTGSPIALAVMYVLAFLPVPSRFFRKNSRPPMLPPVRLHAGFG